ncbi:DEAD/DEAH box helicase domain-containing protein [Besnoitia besnoiti]|uniref:ATP-dependent RNA helicase n=1 Tax=Besnoitia besnoiti TaxID=94643 RepID=A0A2A9MJZ2_BESBE|nr:DEAD/DEAH box helicase domain-containing protein [Besnoitia besnoiti]PFH35712.1 DEAD/DEAH box helicase domain-containing protein [Besnoitia besnoiti]
MTKKRKRAETPGRASGLAESPSDSPLTGKKRKDLWRKVELDAVTFRECQMEGMAELEELDGDAAAVFDLSLASLTRASERRACGGDQTTGGKGREKKKSKQSSKGLSGEGDKEKAKLACGSEDETSAESEDHASGQVARACVSKRKKSRKNSQVPASSSLSTASSASPASSPRSSVDLVSDCSSAETAVCSSVAAPRCTLEEATEQWQYVVELREALSGWLAALDSPSEDLFHPAILRGLKERGFFSPTPIQRAVLLPALRDRKDIVGAAETGSGKTLAYGIPIVCNLLAQALRRNEKEIERKTKKKALLKKKKEHGGDTLCLAAAEAGASDRSDLIADEPFEDAWLISDDEDAIDASAPAGDDEQPESGCSEERPSMQGKAGGPECLIVVPSRELAFQVQRHLEAVCSYTPLTCVCLVGGLSLQKQLRLLGVLRPEIVVGTPGRLFAVVQDAQAALSRAQALGGTVSSIAHSAPALPNGTSGSQLDGGIKPDGEGGRQGRIQRGHTFMATLHTLRFLVLDEADRLMQEGCFHEMQGLLNAVCGTTAFSRHKEEKKRKMKRGQTGSDDNSASLGEGRRIQTFIFSATLAMDPSNRHKKARNAGKKDTRGTLQALMERVHLRKKRLAVVDFSRSGADRKALDHIADRAEPAELNAALTTQGCRKDSLAQGPLKLPEGLSVTLLKTAASEEELYLALFLLKLFVTTPADQPLKVMIFVNAISYVYRLDPVLSMLLGRDKHEADARTLPMSAPFLAEVVGLHSNLQQKQRLKRVERFQSAKRAVLVCTDVACRGLDLREVKEVIHFQAPRSASIFVHRSGRTARARELGEAVCVCGPSHVSDWLQVLKPLQINLGELEPPECMHKDSRVYSQLTKVKRLLTLATQIESAGHHKAKERRATSWLKKAAQAADIMLDSDVGEEEDDAAGRVNHARCTKALKAELSQVSRQ